MQFICMQIFRASNGRTFKSFDEVWGASKLLTLLVLMLQPLWPIKVTAVHSCEVVACWHVPDQPKAEDVTMQVCRAHLGLSDHTAISVAGFASDEALCQVCAADILVQLFKALHAHPMHNAWSSSMCAWSVEHVTRLLLPQAALYQV